MRAFNPLTLLFLVGSALAQTGGNPFNVPSDGFSATAGQPLPLTWTPTSSGTVSLILRSGGSNNLAAGTSIASNIPNSGSFTWTPPSDITMGTDYTVQIIDDSNPNNVNYTPFFTVFSTNTAVSSTMLITSAAPSSSLSLSTLTPSSTPSSISSASTTSASSTMSTSSVSSSSSSSSSSASTSAKTSSSSGSSSTSAASGTTSKASSTSASSSATAASSSAAATGINVQAGFVAAGLGVIGGVMAVL